MAGINLIPVLRFITDTDDQLEASINQAKFYGSAYVLTGGLTLFGNSASDSKTLHFKTVQKHFPELTERYKKMFASTPYPDAEYQTQLEQRVKVFLKKYGLRNRVIATADIQ